jgi:hypothetical protein
VSRLVRTLLAILALGGCRDTYVDLTPPPSVGVITIAPEWVDLIVYDNTHPIAWPYDVDHPEVEAAYLAEIQSARAAAGLPALQVDRLAVEGARAHAFHMMLHTFLGTVNPEGDGPFQRYLKIGAYYGVLRETVLLTNDVDGSLIADATATDVDSVGIGVWRAAQPGLYYVVIDMTWRGR